MAIRNHGNPIVKLDNPGLYVEQLLAGTPDVVDKAFQRYLGERACLPANLRPHSEYLSHRVEASQVRPGATPEQRKAAQQAVYRGIEFGHVALSCTDVEGPVIFNTGPLVTRLRPNERNDRIVYNSAKLIEQSSIIDRVVEQALPVIDPLEQYSELAQYGICMAFHMAGYGEMRKHQEYFGEGRFGVARRIVDKELERYIAETAAQQRDDT